MSETRSAFTPAAVVRAAAGEHLAGQPERAGQLVREQSGGDRTADLTQTALVAGGQVLQVIHEVAGDELEAALLHSIATVNVPREDLRAPVVAAVARYAEPDFALLCRTAAHQLIAEAGETALDAPMDAVLALAALVQQFDNRADLLELSCGKAERLITPPAV